MEFKYFFEELEKIAVQNIKTVQPVRPVRHEDSRKGKSFLKKSIGRATFSSVLGGVTGGLINRSWKGVRGGMAAGALTSGLRDTVAPKDLFYKAE